MRLIGTTEAKVDQKGRVFLPASFRRVMQENTLVSAVPDNCVHPYNGPLGIVETAASPVGSTLATSGNEINRRINGAGESECETRLIMRMDLFEECLVLYPEKIWHARLDALRQRLSVWSRHDQALMRHFVSNAEWLTLDKNGRFLIPKRYLKMSSITDEVTFVGMDDTVEVWATTKYRAQQECSNFAADIQLIMQEGNSSGISNNKD